MPRPHPITIVVKGWEQESQPFRRLHRMVDVYETLLKYTTVLAVQNFYAAQLAREFADVDLRIRQVIFRPALGNWMEFLREVLRCFAQKEDALFCQELFLFGFQKFVPRPKLQKWFQNDGAAGQLLQLRNLYVGHGATLPDEDAQQVLQEHEPALRKLLARAQFLGDYPLYFVAREQESRQYDLLPMMGTGLCLSPALRPRAQTQAEACGYPLDRPFLVACAIQN